MGTAWTNQEQLFLVIPTGATTGARIAINVANSGAILIYNTLGQLFESIASMGGEDPFGNSYGAGTTVGVPFHPQVVITVAADGKSGLIIFPTGSTHIHNSAALQAFMQGAGLAAYDQLQVLGPQDSVQLDNIITTWLSSSNDGTSEQAQFQQIYSDPTGALHVYQTVSCAGTTIEAGSVTAVHPGTGGSRATPAVAETWQTPTLTALWTTTGVSLPVRYKAMPDGTVRIDGEVLTFGTGPWPLNQDIFSVAAAYAPAESHPFITRSDIAVAAGQCTVNVVAGGGVQNGQTFTAAGQRLWFDGVTYSTT